MSAFIKSLDKNHLVAIGDEGFFNQPGNPDFVYQYVSSFWLSLLANVPSRGSLGIDFAANLKISSVDFGTFHVGFRDNLRPLISHTFIGLPSMFSSQSLVNLANKAFFRKAGVNLMTPRGESSGSRTTQRFKILPTNRSSSKVRRYVALHGTWNNEHARIRNPKSADARRLLQHLVPDPHQYRDSWRFNLVFVHSHEQHPCSADHVSSQASRVTTDKWANLR